MHGKGLPREPPLLLGRSFGRRVLSNVTLRNLRQYLRFLNVTFTSMSLEPIVDEIVSLAKFRGLEVNNDIDELVEERNQELTTEELMELHCVSEQEVMAGESVRGGEVNSKAIIFQRLSF
ncbi:hypothetical protein AVEN_116135-1 [Araneus ventricosus]|uniref:Uncharacterized protein n=1 Tax=Araneus ventricosus TaxID=182803 RepID=A0A4Y2L9A6_ARAVE|nr:hypothetical protein AVEN_116135-1 [Araneus ventricosus]